ncbi:tRNA epoxyqueuosine(34) reductase QueG [Alistipes sp.]|uniref:tRNA epoxyqueuosine(34) reductase QueG n=1 Tax=Alistipes sp. TaxID=1872444 RepID=UPI003AB7DEE9
MLQNLSIKKLAARAGFDLCGVTPARPLDDSEAHFREWLRAGRHATLGYLERNLDKRFDPSRLVEGARSVVVCAVGYKNHRSEGYPAGSRTRVASYACTRDYHVTLRGMLHSMLAALQRENPGLTGRAFVDSAPLLEKRLAVEAGLGWIGRQSLLVTPQFGTYVLLGELVLTEETDRYDPPFEGARCGRCRNCIESCPTGAIVAPKIIDAARCIACRTIEPLADAIDANDGDPDGWIFGCDRCQSCCPHNQKAPMHRNPAFDPLFDPVGIPPETWLAMDEREFVTRFEGTPLLRAGLERIRRNLLRILRENDREADDRE